MSLGYQVDKGREKSKQFQAVNEAQKGKRKLNSTRMVANKGIFHIAYRREQYANEFHCIWNERYLVNGLFR